MPKQYEGDLKAEGHQEHDVVRGEEQEFSRAEKKKIRLIVREVSDIIFKENFIARLECITCV